MNPHWLPGPVVRKLRAVSQNKHRASLARTLCVAHLQGHGRGIELIGTQLSITDVSLDPWSRDAYLAGTLGAHREADGAANSRV